MGFELFHANSRSDGRKDMRTDMTKLIVVFHNFAKTPNKIIEYIPE